MPNFRPRFLEFFAGAGVVDDVSVVGCDFDAALTHALGADLLKKERGGDFAAAHGCCRDQFLRRGREALEIEILEDAAGAAHGRRELLVANGSNMGGFFG